MQKAFSQMSFVAGSFACVLYLVIVSPVIGCVTALQYWRVFSWVQGVSCWAINLVGMYAESVMPIALPRKL